RITLAASTAGASPALARRLREELEAYLTDDMPALADLLAEVRTEIRARKLHVDAETWQSAIDEHLRVLLAQRKHRQARAYLVERLGIVLGDRGDPHPPPPPPAWGAGGGEPGDSTSARPESSDNMRAPSPIGHQ